MSEQQKTTDDERLAAVLRVLERRHGPSAAQHIHHRATTTDRGRVDSVAYTRWVDAAKEAQRNGYQ